MQKQKECNLAPVLSILHYVTGGNVGLKSKNYGDVMKNALLLLVLLAVLSGCADSRKYVELNIDKDACLIIFGSVDPSFLREGTTETDTQTITPSTDLNIIPVP